MMALCMCAVNASAADTRNTNDAGGVTAVASLHEPLLNEIDGDVIAPQQEADATQANDAAADSDGIDANTATVWIAVICGGLFCVIMAFVIVLAKKNNGAKK